MTKEEIKSGASVGVELVLDRPVNDQEAYWNPETGEKINLRNYRNNLWWAHFNGGPVKLLVCVDDLTNLHITN